MTCIAFICRFFWSLLFNAKITMHPKTMTYMSYFYTYMKIIPKCE